MGYDDGLKVKLVIKRKHREEIVKLLKEKKTDMTLCSDTLGKISEIINRGSRTYVPDKNVNEERRPNNIESLIKKKMKEEISKIDG